MNITSLYEIYLRYLSIQTDTRKIKAGDLFFALKGPNFNGNQFAATALSLGAAYCIVDEAEYALNDHCILVDDVLQTLQQLALHHRQQFNIPFIAITGSNGKTTSKELLATVLKEQYVTYATEGNLNNHIGIPLTILKIKKDAQIAIIEMGANHQKEIASYCRIALPTHGIINNCGKAHIEGFGGIEGVRKGKGELYDFIRENNGIIFRNADLDYLQEMAKGIDQQITYGKASAQYMGQPIHNNLMLDVAIVTPGFETTIHSRLVGDYNFANIMLAVAVGAYFGMNIDQIKTAIEAYAPDNSRSQLIEIGSNRVILDAYNANPTSMRAAISNFALSTGNKVLWLGAMKEMGADEAKEHQELITYLNDWEWQQIILVGAEFKPFAGDNLWFADSIKAADFIARHKPQNSLVLIKGSRGSKMEQLIDALY